MASCFTGFFPALNISAPAFAVAGMAGVVGGATGAAMAAIVMIFEMTLDYTVIIPMTLVVAISYGLRRSVTKDSIYTRKLVLRGDPVPESLRADLQFTRRAASIMNTHDGDLCRSNTFTRSPVQQELGFRRHRRIGRRGGSGHRRESDRPRPRQSNRCDRRCCTAQLCSCVSG